MNKSVEGNNFSSQNGKRQDGVRCILNQESKTTKIKMLVSKGSLQICIFYDQCMLCMCFFIKSSQHPSTLQKTFLHRVKNPQSFGYANVL